jgi:hypothetical protein
MKIKPTKNHAFKIIGDEDNLRIWDATKLCLKAKRGQEAAKAKEMNPNTIISSLNPVASRCIPSLARVIGMSLSSY